MKYDVAMLDELVSRVLESAKYRCVAPGCIRRIAARELSIRPNSRTALQETKNSLHRAAGAYLEARPPYARWREELEQANDDALPELAMRYMRSHTSTRERIPTIETFWQKVLPDAAQIQSVLDVASGFNPLSAPWMGLPANARYISVDLYSDMMEFMEAFLTRMGLQAEGRVIDAVADPPADCVDLAIVLKFLPVLEQTQRGGTLPWLRQLNAKSILASFPTGSLGGSGWGRSVANNGDEFERMVIAEGWRVERHIFPSELCFRMYRDA